VQHTAHVKCVRMLERYGSRVPAHAPMAEEVAGRQRSVRAATVAGMAVQAGHVQGAVSMARKAFFPARGVRRSPGSSRPRTPQNATHANDAAHERLSQ